MKLPASDAASRHVVDHEHAQPANIDWNTLKLGWIAVKKVHRFGARQSEGNAQMGAGFGQPGTGGTKFSYVFQPGYLQWQRIRGHTLLFPVGASVLHHIMARAAST